MKRTLKISASMITVAVAGFVFSGCKTSTVQTTSAEAQVVLADHSRPFSGQMIFKILSAQETLKAGDASEASDLYEQIAKRYPDTKNVHFYALNYASLAGRKDRVESNLVHIIERHDSGDLALATYQIQQLLKISMSIDAQSLSMRLYDKLLEVGMADEELLALFEKSDLEFSRRKSDGVLLFLRLAANARKDRLLYEAWIHVLVAREHYVKAASVVKDGLAMYPGYHGFHYLDAESAFNSGSYKEAGEKAKIIAGIPKPRYQFLLAQIYERNNEEKKARALFEKLSEDDTYKHWANYFLGVMYIRNNLVSEAEEALKKVQSDELIFQRNYALANMYRKQKRYKEALRLLENANVQTEEQLEQSLIVASQIFFEAGDEKTSLKLLNDFLAKYPNRIGALYQRGSFLISLDDLEGFERDMRKIISIDDTHSEALNGLGYILTDRLGRAEEALPLIERALKIQPKAYHILDSLGWAKFRLKNYEEAILYLRQALDLKYDPEIIGHLVEVLFVSGQAEEANILWEEAREKFPSAEVLGRVGNLIRASKDD